MPKPSTYNFFLIHVTACFSSNSLTVNVTLYSTYNVVRVNEHASFYYHLERGQTAWRHRDCGGTARWNPQTWNMSQSRQQCASTAPALHYWQRFMPFIGWTYCSSSLARPVFLTLITYFCEQSNYRYPVQCSTLLVKNELLKNESHWSKNSWYQLMLSVCTLVLARKHSIYGIEPKPASMKTRV